jgi:hypothetical protein
VPVGAALETTAAFNLSTAGNAKTHSTPPSRNDDGVEHK